VVTPTAVLPPGPERRAQMLAAGQNVSARDFTAEERAAMAAETEMVRDAREWMPFLEPDE